MTLKIKALFLILFGLCFFPAITHAAQPFEKWVEGFKKEAISKGISKKLLDDAFVGVRPIPRIIVLDRKQPEGTMTFAKYRKNIINEARVEQGRRLYKQHRKLLESVSQKYGVPPQYIVALWGIETSYGNNTGGFGVVPALATLAYDGRRSEFFRTELMNAFKILNAGHISLEKMKGSWAGAMGQNQFMPSSFHAFAVDGNGDGKRDIWTNLPDVFSSTANYLGKSGWKEDERWGREVRIPSSFTKDMIGVDARKTMDDWKRLGVTLPDGSPLPTIKGMKAAVVAPDGVKGSTYIVYDNYKVIMKWNKSTYFATSVGLLADRIANID